MGDVRKNRYKNERKKKEQPLSAQNRETLKKLRHFSRPYWLHVSTNTTTCKFKFQIFVHNRWLSRKNGELISAKIFHPYEYKRGRLKIRENWDGGMLPGGKWTKKIGESEKKEWKMRGNNVAEEICIHCKENEHVLIKCSLSTKNFSFKMMIFRLGKKIYK